MIIDTIQQALKRLDEIDGILRELEDTPTLLNTNKMKGLQDEKRFLERKVDRMELEQERMFRIKKFLKE